MAYKEYKVIHVAEGGCGTIYSAPQACRLRNLKTC